MVGSDDDARATTLAVSSADPGRTRAETDATAAAMSPSGSLAMPATIGRYRLVNRLGAGAMGVVWSAVDPQLQRKVAIKVVHPRLASAPEASGRMLREARAMAKLSHRAVVTVFDAGEVGGQLFLAMELIDGETLTARLRRPDVARPDAWRQRLAFVLEAGRGLAAAHAAGVLHRDFKPDNVLVDQSGRVCVGDFGLATLGEREGPRRARVTDLMLTTTGALLGTPMYMSPDQLRGEPADARGDQFAFCVTAFEALYGVRPFAITVTSGLEAIPALIGEIEAGRLVAPPADSQVPAAVRDVLRRGLAAVPAERWPDVAAVVAALDAASGLRARRRRRVALAIAGAAAIGTAVALGALVFARGPERHAEKRSLFRVPLDATLALGPGGKTMALGYDHIDVYEAGSDAPLSVSLGSAAHRVYGLELGEDEVSFSRYRGGARESWRYRTGPAPTGEPPQQDLVWVARLGDGDLMVNGNGTSVTQLSFVRGGALVESWPMTFDGVRTLAVSPDHERFAFIDQRTSQIVVQARGAPTALRSAPVSSPTALAWSDATHLLMSRGNLVGPTIESIPVTDTEIGPRRVLYRQDAGWFMRLASRDGRTVFVDANPVSRVRVFGVDVTGRPANRDHEPTLVSAELGWTDGGELLVWTRGSRMVSRGPIDGARTDVGITLDSEPINATRAGDLLIAALRAEDGRNVVAYDLRTGARRWRLDGQLDAVRCTEDRIAPCVALQSSAGGKAIVEIDPTTGTRGRTLTTLAEATDVALTASGHLWVTSSRSAFVRELDHDGRELTRLTTGLSAQRSIALTPDGGVVVAGTILGNTYCVGEMRDGVFHAVMTTDNELMLLARPSPTTNQIAVIGRTFSTELAELILP